MKSNQGRKMVRMALSSVLRLEKKLTIKFMVPGLYSMVKLKPNNLPTQ